MGKVSQFSIHLDRAQGIYMAGETVAGRMFIRVAERIKLNYIRMLMHGFARVHWTEQHGSGENVHTVSYDAFEEYIHFNRIFLEKQPGSSGDLYLEAGEWNYPFQVALPQNLPTSFEHAFGRVRYTLEGHIDIPWAFDKRVTLSFSVINPVDLNLRPMLRQPANVSEQKTICCWCCASEPITATLSIPKGGYVPGEAIVFNATIDNKSSTDLKEITFKLVQKVALHATTKTRVCYNTIAQIPFSKKVYEKSYDDWRNAVLVVPPACPSSGATCRIMEISYYVNLHLNPSGASRSFDCYIPVTIGTIPLLQPGAVESKNYNYAPSEFDKNDRLDDEKKEGEVTNMDANFAPLYPYYKDFSIIPR